MKEMFFMESIVFGQCYADERMERKLSCEDCLSSECMLYEEKGVAAESRELKLVG